MQVILSWVFTSPTEFRLQFAQGRDQGKLLLERFNQVIFSARLANGDHILFIFLSPIFLSV
ncbi:MAG: hypothetical protein NXI32_01760 [bacterium]|nr:hypothetical protein [bacterium]